MIVTGSTFVMQMPPTQVPRDDPAAAIERVPTWSAAGRMARRYGRADHTR